jgi:hypothetical protein
VTLVDNGDPSKRQCRGERCERVGGLIDDAVVKGAVLAAGGRGNGTIMPATIVDYVTPAMRIYGEAHWSKARDLPACRDKAAPSSPIGRQSKRIGPSIA